MYRPIFKYFKCKTVSHAYPATTVGSAMILPVIIDIVSNFGLPVIIEFSDIGKKKLFMRYKVYILKIFLSE